MPATATETHEFWLGTPATVHPYVVTVTRPDRPTLYFGYTHLAEAMAAAVRFRQALTHTAHLDGTTVTWAANDAGTYAYSPVPTDPITLSGLLHSEPDTDPAERFPDLYTRLDAQIGEDARRVWASACHLIDQDSETEDALCALADGLNRAATALDDATGAAATLAKLHPDYDGTLGEDIAAHLEAAARSLRAADALHRQVVSG